jgi:hypothetical protein
MAFTDTLPPDKRGLLWLPQNRITLTLPNLAGEYVVFETYWNPQQNLIAYNVAAYVRPQE